MPRFNKIFAGPATENTPQVRELPAASATILPGCLIVPDSGEFALAGAATVGKVYIAQENYLAMEGVDTAYAEDDTVIGMELLDGQAFRGRIANGVNAVAGVTQFTTAANGLLAVAGDEDYVVAVADEDFNNTTGETQLVTIRAAVGHYTPAAG